MPDQGTNGSGPPDAGTGPLASFLRLPLVWTCGSSTGARPAAADRVVLLRGFGTDPADERRTLAAMLTHPPALAIVEATPGGGSPAGLVLDSRHPLLEHEVSTAYRRVATTAFGGSIGGLFDVWVTS